MIKRAAAIIAFDIRNLSRDGMLAMLIIVTLGFAGLLVAAGLNREALGFERAQNWVPYLSIFYLITNVGSMGMIFALVLIEEAETGARAALMTTPVPPRRLLLWRTAPIILWLTIQPLALVYALAWSWDAPILSLAEWLSISFSLSTLGAAAMILLATAASNRVEALALGKFAAAVTAPAMLLYLAPADAWWRALLYIFPTAPAIEAFEAFRADRPEAAYLWLAAGVAYAALIFAAAVRGFLRRSYRVVA